MVMEPRKRPGQPSKRNPGKLTTTRRGIRATRRLTAVRPLRVAQPAGTRRHPLWTVLAAYLSGTFVLLAIVFLALPQRAGGLPAPGARTWDYQLETVALQGHGLLNAYARGAVRTTAWLARSSIERQRDVHRLNLLECLAAYGVLRRPAGREWLAAVLVLLALTAVVTRPVTTTRLAGRAGVAVPNLVLRAAIQGDASRELRGGSQQVQQALAGRYW